MRLPTVDFALERYFARYEFNVRHILSASDCESVSWTELIAGADDEALALWNDLRLGYTESQGHPLLRAEIAGLYPGATADQVLVAAPEEAVLLAMQALLQPGDHVIVTFPGYQSLYQLAESMGCKVTRWTLTPNGEGWNLDFAALEGMVTPQTRLIVANFPHNPTGFLPTVDEQQHMVGVARRHGLYLFSDEMYRWLEYEPSNRLPAMCGLYERGISLCGLSKTFALPGLRIGWLASQAGEVIDACGRLKDYTTICASAPAEILGLIGLRRKEWLIRRSLGLVRQNLLLAEDFFSRHVNLFTWLKPAAGSIAFPSLAPEYPADVFCHNLVEKANILVVPSTVFAFPGNHVRIGLGRADFAAGLEIFDDYLAGLGRPSEL
jgi:aspartate/methionine/tyrosine aminotransferase